MRSDIKARLESDLEYVRSLGYEVLGVFLQGSQNYGLEYEHSDIDTKCIVLPRFNDFCLAKKPVSQTLLLPSDEHIDLKDIRLMFDCFKRQNVNYLEILFTPYRVINEKYTDVFYPCIENAEAIARYNEAAFISGVYGVSLEKLKALEHPYPATMEKIKKFGYDPKQLHHILRLNEFAKRYIDGEKYGDSLIPRNREYLIEVKRGCYSLEQARKLADDTAKDTARIRNEFVTAIEKSKPRETVNEILDSVLVNVLKRCFGIK